MFKKFALGDVFNIYSPKKRFNANTVQFGGKYPYVARGSSNNGIRGYITEDEQYLSPAKSLSFGQDTATVFYQPDAYFTGDKIKVMVLNNHDLNDELAQYFITVITKSFSTFAWGQSSFNEKILKATEIVLPVIESPDPDHEYTVEDIDFEYMQERIAELEEERIAELDAYLAASGLDDYELTDEDKEILSLSPESASDEAGASETDHGDGQVVFKAFKIGNTFNNAIFKNFYLKDIFGGEPIRGTRLTKENRISGSIPLVTAGEQNEGIAEYISNSENQTLSNMLTIDMFGNCFYRDYLYKSDDNILSFGLNGKSTEEMLYIASIINSICKKQYSYGKQYRKSSYLETTIPLPVIGSSDPDHEYTPADIDWQYMERYIRAIEKLAIADVVKYKDKIIDTTKQLVTA